MNGWTPVVKGRGCHHLASSTTTTCTDADTDYKVGGTWTDGEQCNKDFNYDGSGKITFTGDNGTFFLFNGVSDLEADKVCRVSYTLYINGIAVSGSTTPTDFEHANSIGSISITNFIKLDKDDYIEVYVQSDTAVTDITHQTLLLTFLEA